MSTSYPTGLDVITNPTAAQLESVAPVHSVQHATENDAIEAIEGWLGVLGSTVTTSLVYRLAALEKAAGSYGKWNVFTPEWTAVTSNPSIASGVRTGATTGAINGAWSLQGRRMLMRINIEMGDDTTYGSGNWVIGGPGFFSALVPQGMPGWAYNSATGIAHPVFWEQSPSEQASWVRLANGAGYVTATTPFTWTSGCYLRLQGEMEVA